VAKPAPAKKAAPKPAPTNAAVNDYIAQYFGMTDALIKMDHSGGRNLQWAMDQITKQKITDPQRAAELIASTSWFKTYGSKVMQKQAESVNNPALYKQNLAGTTSTIQGWMTAQGINLSAHDLAAVSKDAYMYGLNEQQTLGLIVNSHGTASGGGAVGSAMDQIKTTALNNGVTLTASDLTNYQNNLMDNTRDSEYYNTSIRAAAAAKYSVFAPQLTAGHDLSDLIKPYTDIASSLLETPLTSTNTMDDPLFRDGKAFTQVGADGQPAIKPTWQFRADVMADPRWQHTQNAKDTYTNMGLSVLQKFGLAS